MPSVQPITVIFLGPQGSGKGTQVALLKEFLSKQDNRSIVYFTAGTALRAFSVGEGYTQERIRPMIIAGKLIPDFITNQLFSSRLIGGIHGDEHIILDGFPRTILQTPDLESALQFYNRQNAVVIQIQLSENVAKERMQGRKREDDTQESIEERLRWSRENAEEIGAWFKAHPTYQFFEINGERTIEEVHADILKALGFAQ